MNNKKITLADALDFVVDNRGKTVPTTEKGFPLIATNCISNDNLYPSFLNVRYISTDTYNNWFRSHPLPDDIIITNKGSQNGAVCFVPNPVTFCIAQDMVALRAKRDLIYPKFLFAALRSQEVQNQIKNLNVDGVIPHFKKTDFNKLKLPNPCYKNQKIIGDFYFNFCEKINLNNQINQTLESIAQAIFKSWFIDFEPVRAKIAAKQEGKDPERAAMCAISGKTQAELDQLTSDDFAELQATAALFPDELVETELGDVPKGWDAKALGNFLEIKRGGSPRPIQNFMSPTGYPWVKIADATADPSPFLFKTKEFIIEEGLKKTVYLKKGSLILTNSATPGLPKFLELDACIHDGWLYFPQKKHFSDSYLYFLFLKIRSQLVAQGNGSVFTNLKTDILRNQVILVPTKEVIEKFDLQVFKILEIMKIQCIQSSSLSNLRDTLLPKLLSAEVDLTAIEDKKVD